MEQREHTLKTTAELKEEAVEKALDSLYVPYFEREEAKDWDFVKKAVSNILLEGLVGRPKPVGRHRVTPVRDAFLLTREYMVPTYPKNLKTDSQKQSFINRLYLEEGMSDQVYADMLSVLKVKKPSKKKIIF